jgi:hypothetical protein
LCSLLGVVDMVGSSRLGFTNPGVRSDGTIRTV